MKRNLFLAACAFCVVSCSDSGTKNGTTNDTSAPVNATSPTPTNPSGLQPNGGTGTTTNAGDSNTNMNDLNRPKNTGKDSMR